MNMQRLTPGLLLVPLTLATGVFGQTSLMSDSQKIEYLMQQVQKLQAQVKELKTTQQKEVLSIPTVAEASPQGRAMQ
jgi:hypothetical protein